MIRRHRNRLFLSGASARAGAGIPLSGTTWNPADKSANINLSNGNLTATGNGTVANFLARATSSISGVQKIYFETTASVLVSTSPGFGLANATESLANFLGATANSIGYFNNGQVFVNNVLVTTIAAFLAGNIIGTAVDFANGKAWFRVGAGGWLNDILANQNPATNTGGIVHGIAGALFPTCNLNTNAATTANFGSGFANAAPAGFTFLP